MRYQSIIRTFIVLATISFVSCSHTFNKIMCGEPNGKQKLFIDSINLQLKNKLTLSHVPCYQDYMEVHLKVDYEKSIIDSLENEYSRSINWVEFLVYNKEGKLIRGSTGSM